MSRKDFEEMHKRIVVFYSIRRRNMSRERERERERVIKLRRGKLGRRQKTV